MRTALRLVTSLLVASVIAAVPLRAEDLQSTAERYFRAVYSGDVSTVAELAADDIVVSYPVFKEVLGAPAIRGRDGVVEFSKRFSSRWLDQALSVHEAVADGNAVVLVWSFRATRAGESDGAESEAAQESSWGGITFFRFDGDGKVPEEVGEESEPGPHHRLSGGAAEH